MQGPAVLSYDSSPSFEIVEVPPRRTGDGVTRLTARAVSVLAEGTDRVPTLAPVVERGTLVGPMVLARMLVALLVLNVIDAVMTLWAIRLGVATEANPIMAAALEIGEPVFLLTKLSVVGVGCAVLWAARHRRIAQIGTCVCVTVYVFLAAVHMWTGALIAEALAAVV